MNRTKPIIVLALLLAAQTAANADSRIAKFCSPGPMDDRAMFTAIAVTIHLTNQGKLIRLPHVKPMTSMAECRAWTHQTGVHARTPRLSRHLPLLRLRIRTVILQGLAVHARTATWPQAISPELRSFNERRQAETRRCQDVCCSRHLRCSRIANARRGRATIGPSRSDLFGGRRSRGWPEFGRAVRRQRCYLSSS